MDTTSFHKLRTAVQENANPADELMATRLRESLHAALSGSRLFGDVEFGRTDDPDQMVIGVCRCADDVLPWEAGMGIERLWASIANGVRWEAHTVGCTSSLMEFEGAVTVDESGHYITVHVVAEPSEATRAAIAAEATQAAEADEAAEAVLSVPAEIESVRG